MAQTNVSHLKTLITTAAVLLVLFTTGSAQAAGSGITYQGRILKPNGNPLAGANVQFRLQIRTPGTQSCLMYEELQTQDMRLSEGMFSLTMNDGTGTRTDSSGYGLDRVFANKGSFTFASSACATGTTYNTSPDDGRKLVVYFKDETMSTWEPMPAQNINFVPLAIESKQIGGFTIDNLVRVEEADGTLTAISPLSNANYDALKLLVAGTSGLYERSGRLGGAAISGTPLAGQVLSYNGTQWTAVDPISGVQAFAKTALPTCTAGQFLKDNGSGSLICATPSGTATGTVTEVSAGTGLTTGGSPITSTGSIALATLGAGGTGFKVTYDIYGRVTGAVALVEADIPTLSTAGKVSGSAITSGTIGGSTAINTSGAITTSGAVSTGALNATSVTSPAASLTALSTQGVQIFETTNNFKITLQAPASLGADYSLTFPAAAGASGKILGTTGSGVLTWVDPSNASQWTTSGSDIYYSTGNVGIGTSTPVAALDVVGQLRLGTNTTTPADGAGYVYKQSAGTTLSGYQAIIETGSAGSRATRMTVDYDGKVGIGTSVPVDTLDVRTAIGDASIAVSRPVNSNQAYVGLNTAGTVSSSNVNWAFGMLPNSNSANIQSWDGTVVTPRLTVTNDGKVGIGTTAPTSALEVRGTTFGSSAIYSTRIQSGTAAGGFWNQKARGAPGAETGVLSGDSIGNFGAVGHNSSAFGTGGYFEFIAANDWSSTNQATDMHLRLNPGAADNTTPVVLAVKSNGNLGVGMASPSTKLQVAGSLTLGDGAETCTGGAYAGALRYNASTLAVEFCNGTGWLAMNSGSSSTSANLANITNSSGGITLTPAALNSVTIASSVASTSPTTGALIVSGGLGVDGAINASGGITTPGVITAGATSTSGSVLLQDNYSPGHLTILGSEYSSGGPVLGYAVAPSTTAQDAFISSTPASVSRSAITLAEQIKFNIGLNQTVAPGSPATLGEVARIDSNGLQVNNGQRISGSGAPASGSGMELGYGTGAGFIQPYNRTTSTYEALNLISSSTRFSNGSTELMRIDGATGKIAIGTTTPSTILTVQSHTDGLADGIRIQRDDYATNGGYLILNKDAGAGSVANIQAGDNFNYTPLALNAAGGNVGVGTTSPSTRIHIAESGFDQFRLQNGGQSLWMRQGFKSDGTATPVSDVRNVMFQSSGSSPGTFSFSNGNNESVRITETGNVGIGTTSPAYKLDVNGAINATAVKINGIDVATSGGAGGGQSSTSGLTFNTDSDNAGTDGGAVFQNNGTTLMTIGRNGVVTTGADIGGSISIGRQDNTNEGGEINWSGSGSYPGWVQDVFQSAMRFYTNSASDTSVNISNNGAGVANLLVDGKVGIGTTTPSASLHVASPTNPRVIIQDLTNDFADPLYSGWISGQDKNGTEAWWVGEGSSVAKMVALRSDVAGYSVGLSNTAGQLTLGDTGNVGIGTSAPSMKLQVSGGDVSVVNGSHPAFFTTNSSKTDGTYGRTWGMMNYSGGFFLNAYPSTGSDIAPGGPITALYAQDTTGNIGIGTTSPAVRLDVKGRTLISTALANVMTVIGTGAGYADSTNGVLVVQSENTTGSGGTVLLASSTYAPNAFAVVDNGNVGVGTRTPAAALDVAGQIRPTMGAPSTDPSSNNVDFVSGNTQYVTLTSCPGNAATLNLHSMLEGGSYSLIVITPVGCMVSFTGTSAAVGAGGGTVVSAFKYPGGTTNPSTGEPSVYSFLRANNIVFGAQVADFR